MKKKETDLSFATARASTTSLFAVRSQAHYLYTGKRALQWYYILLIEYFEGFHDPLE